ncbi:MAG: coenzyme F430 synthase [Methanomassiliicoccales archaeon]
MKILILDLTHGGEVLAESYAEKGDEVTAVDIYHNCPPATKARLLSAGIRVMDSTPHEWFNVAVSPIHGPERFLQGASFERRLTHHQAVGELAHFSYPVIEVTGAVAKTSSCHILAHILRSKGMKVLVLTSSGLLSVGKTVEVIEERASIAPATILRLSKMKGDWDYGIFECSLGGTGLADIGMVTNMHEEYRIAGGTRSSNVGKMQMVRSAKHKIVIAAEDETIIEDEIPEGAEVTTFGSGGDIQVTILKDLRLGERAPAVLRVNQRNIPLTLSGGFLAPSYSTGLSAAAALAYSAGVGAEDIAGALTSFEGVPGRGEVARQNGTIVIRERNPGVTARSIDWNLMTLEEYYHADDIALVVDPVNVKVCEKLDIDDIAKVASLRACVKAAYVVDRGLVKELQEPLIRTSKPEEVIGTHAVTLWCTKEGYI